MVCIGRWWSGVLVLLTGWYGRSLNGIQGNALSFGGIRAEIRSNKCRTHVAYWLHVHAEGARRREHPAPAGRAVGSACRPRLGRRRTPQEVGLRTDARGGGRQPAEGTDLRRFRPPPRR